MIQTQAQALFSDDAENSWSAFQVGSWFCASAFLWLLCITFCYHLFGKQWLDFLAFGEN